jgi:hypothetical protein
VINGDEKKTLFWIGILFLVSAIGSALAPNPYFSPFRFIGGIGVGHHLLLYLYFRNFNSKNRGKLGTLFNLILFSEFLIAFFPIIYLKDLEELMTGAI